MVTVESYLKAKDIVPDMKHSFKCIDIGRRDERTEATDRRSVGDDTPIGGPLVRKCLPLHKHRNSTTQPFRSTEIKLRQSHGRI